MLKRIVGLVVGTTVVCSAFAASAATVTSTTTYGEVVDGVQKVSVKSDVSDVAVGNTLTYLATEDGADLATLLGEEIVYIDQVTLVDGMAGLQGTTYSFNYTANANEAINANVKVGGAVAAEGDIVGPACTVSGVVSGTVAYGAEGFTTFEFADSANVIGVTVDGVAATYGTGWFNGAGGISINNALFANKATADVAFSYDTAEKASTTANGIAYKASDNSIIIIGTALGNAKEYGFIIDLGDDTPTKLKALGKGSDGRFAIKITGIQNVTEGTIVKATAYHTYDGLAGDDGVVSEITHTSNEATVVYGGETDTVGTYSTVVE